MIIRDLEITHNFILIAGVPLIKLVCATFLSGYLRITGPLKDYLMLSEHVFFCKISCATNELR